jgi:hypothetical protein
VSGHGRAHHVLEERLAEWMAPHLEQARALTLCTGYMANLAILTALGLDADATIFSEELNHASLIDGARLAKAGVTVYPHGDVAALDAQLQASSARTKIVVTDSVFSMDGNRGPADPAAGQQGAASGTPHPSARMPPAARYAPRLDESKNLPSWPRPRTALRAAFTASWPT